MYCKILLGPLDEFRCHVSGFIALGMLLEKIRKEEYLEDGKHDEKLDENNRPQRLAEAHVPETVVIEIEGPV